MMTKKKREQAGPFAGLTWDDLEQWVGGKILSRGERYQRQGRVSELAVTSDGGLIAWVSGTQQYATKVVMDEEGLPDSVCTCPYAINCKHGVAVVLEYLEQIGEDRRIPQARESDDRLVLVEGRGEDEIPEEGEPGLSEPVRLEIEPFLQEKSKAQLVELLLELAEQHPDIAQDLVNRQQILSGSTKKLVARLRKEIREVGAEPGWQRHWSDEGYTPDYSEIRRKLNTLLEAGHPDEVLDLGRELMIVGLRQAEESDDEGETADQVASCMPVIVEALDRSSLSLAAKLAWAVEAVLKDPFEICSDFEEYLGRRHPKEAWNTLADQLLTQLKTFGRSRSEDEFSRNYARDRLSDWAIYALQHAGRPDEIIPLCEAEAPKTGSYERLVGWLIHKHRYEDAERWIHEGIRATEKKLPGIAQSLRDQLKTIRASQKDTPALAALEVEEFVRSPSRKVLADCEKTSRDLGVWPSVRAHLLTYLESGVLPWKQKGWPLPLTGLDVPERAPRQTFPLVEELIDIAIYEKDPERVLYWYDRRPKSRFGWAWVDEDRIAEAIETYAPDRAVAIWKSKAENLIARASPSAYEEAARYLRKVGAVLAREGRQQEWTRYLQELRDTHARKRRLIEVLDRVTRKPILSKKTES
jgi:uncharacterized Zn finger protein